MRGVAELSTVEAYECCALHVSLLGWVIMASDMKPDPIPIRLLETQYVQAFTKTSYLLFWRPVMETNISAVHYFWIDIIYRNSMKGLRSFFSKAIWLRRLPTIALSSAFSSPLVVNIPSNSKRHLGPPLKRVWISMYFWKACIWSITGFPPGHSQSNGSRAFSNRLFHCPK